MPEVIEKSEKIIISRTMEEDLEFILDTERHPDNSPYVGQWSEEEHRGTFADPCMLHLTVRSYCEDRGVGYAIIAGLQNPNQSIELRRLVISDKGKGYGRETLRLIKKHTFETLKAHRLWLDVREHNSGARSLYTSEGFTEEGILRECIFYNGSYESLIVMSILQDEYTWEQMNNEIDPELYFHVIDTENKTGKDSKHEHNRP